MKKLLIVDDDFMFGDCNNDYNLCHGDYVQL